MRKVTFNWPSWSELGLMFAAICVVSILAACISWLIMLWWLGTLWLVNFLF